MRRRRGEARAGEGVSQCAVSAGASKVAQSSAIVQAARRLTEANLQKSASSHVPSVPKRATPPADEKRSRESSLAPSKAPSVAAERVASSKASPAPNRLARVGSVSSVLSVSVDSLRARHPTLGRLAAEEEPDENVTFQKRQRKSEKKAGAPTGLRGEIKRY